MKEKMACFVLCAWNTENHNLRHVEHGLHRRPLKNWGKATDLLAKKHEKGQWNLASIETQALSESAKQHGDVMD